MKNSILFFVLLAGFTASACDFCNCYVGLNPQYKRNLAGLRYMPSFYSGSHHSNQELSEMGYTNTSFKEIRTSYEFHGQFYPVQKIQLMISVPYVVNKETMHATFVPAVSGHTHHGDPQPEPGVIDEEEVISGFSDPLMIAHYQVFNFIGTDTASFSQRLLAGVGVKFPAGKWKLGADADPQERIHQPGSGSFDYIVDVIYLSQFRKFGLNVNANYMITGENSESFKYGNRLNLNAVVLYKINSNNFSFYPNAGAYYEDARTDTYQLTTINNSGGNILYAHAGFDIYYGNFSFSPAFHIPVYRNLNGVQPLLQSRIIAGFSYAFN